MMEYKIEIGEQAKNDIVELALWYDSQKLGLGKVFIQNLDLSFIAISERAEMYPIVISGVRRFLMKKFPCSVHYLVENNIVRVMGVLHFKRNPSIIEFRIGGI